MSLVGVVTAVTWAKVGAVVSTKNVFTLNGLLTCPKESVTVMVQFEWVPSLKLNEMELVPLIATVVVDQQDPP